MEEKHTPYAMQFTLAETHQGILGEVGVSLSNPCIWRPGMGSGGRFVLT